MCRMFVKVTVQKGEVCNSEESRVINCMCQLYERSVLDIFWAGRLAALYILSSGCLSAGFYYSL